VLWAVTLALLIADSSAPPPASGPPAKRPLVVAGLARRSTAADPRTLCDAERKRVLAQPGLPGAPVFEAARTHIFGYTKAEPVLFVRAPEHEASSDSMVRRYRRTLDIAKYPWDVLRWLVPRFVHHPEHGRGALLREGYLYADTPAFAFALADHVRLHHLFDAERVYIQRGRFTSHAERGKDGKYRYVDGPQAGKPVRLLLLDRVGVGQPPPALHRDLRALRYQLYFDAARIVHMTPDRIVADLRYGPDWIPSVLATAGAEVELLCESVPPGTGDRLAERRTQAANRERLLEPLRAAMIASIEEQIPFDEPITEYGQQDGHMRLKWLQAYLAGKKTYRFNGDRYFIFDERGRPRPPQVCVDFVYDTLERASGTWWQPRGARPERTRGRVDFGTFTDTTLRRADRFIELARTDTERFELHELPPRERIPMGHRNDFFAYLQKHADDFIPGDIVLIRGYTPWDRPWQEQRIMHYHSFFVYERDPVTGIPIALVGNAGRPSIRTWLFEGIRTPRRSIWYRIRPRVAWLESVIAPEPGRRVIYPPLLSIGTEA
jgi:hypothetical protein